MAPSATNFATNNSSIVGLIEPGDSVFVQISEAVDLDHIIPAWNGADTSVVVKFFDDVGGDVMVVCTVDGPSCLIGGDGASNLLGRVTLGVLSYVSNTVTFDAALGSKAGTNTFTIKLVSCLSNCASIGNGLSSTAAFIPRPGALPGGIRDLVGNPIDSNQPTETSVHF